jgi:hypothetical protein
MDETSAQLGLPHLDGAANLVFVREAKLEPFK